ncbi:hypothetical protein [Streptomyces sp. NBC_01268]|uniref:hypothetical protein n=1 Tax=Streptomyces sp. NBC_01268 TaxID=2903806 RepID=UPI002E32CC1F|nr:hypothetical protein [Streptomyces sp. NBC_01268]
MLLSAAISVGPLAFTPLAAAAPERLLKVEALALNPGSGPPGTSVTVTGTGFEHCDAAHLGLEGGPATTAYVQQATHTLHGVVQIPQGTAVGGHEIVADCSPDADYATSTFTVTGATPPTTPPTTPPSPNEAIPAVTLDRSEGPPGATFNVSGSGFGKCYAEDVELYVDQAKALDYRIDVGAETGTFTQELKVPADAKPGTYQIRAVCVGYPGTSASAPFKVTGTGTEAHPSLTLDPAQGEKGTPVRAVGTGFTCPDVEIGWDDGGAALGTASVAEGGGFSTGIKAPDDAKPGAHTVRAVCTADPKQYADASFTVKDTAPGTTGDQNGGNQNGGDQNGGDQNGGDQNGGNQNGGDQNGGNQNGGDQNGGNQNGGDQNGGNQNGGDQNGGDQNGGNQNGGDQNGGNQNGGTTDGSGTTGSTTGGDTGGSTTPVGWIAGPASLGGALALAVAAGAYFGRLHRGPRWVRGHVKATLRPVTGSAELAETRAPGEPPTHSTRLDPHPDPGRQNLDEEEER